MNNKKLKVFRWVLYIIYIISIGYFLIKKNFASAGMSTFCLVVTLILTMLYYRKVEILDTSLYVVLNLFIFFSILLGSSYDLYQINHYDDFLHFWSGVIGLKIGYNALKALQVTGRRNKIIFLVVIFLVGMGISSIFEIVEYSMDTLFGANTQAGGLKDTMHDMIDSLLGAIIMVIYYINKLRKDNNTWIFK
jgi:uncharacterized membrane protein YjdF